MYEEAEVQVELGSVLRWEGVVSLGHNTHGTVDAIHSWEVLYLKSQSSSDVLCDDCFPVARGNFTFHCFFLPLIGPLSGTEVQVVSMSSALLPQISPEHCCRWLLTQFLLLYRDLFLRHKFLTAEIKWKVRKDLFPIT